MVSLRDLHPVGILGNRTESSLILFSPYMFRTCLKGYTEMLPFKKARNNVLTAADALL